MPAEQPDHPKLERLREFALGSLANDELERISEHIQSCGRCLSAVDDLLGSDKLLGLLRSTRALSGDSPESEQERQEAALALRRRLAAPSDAAWEHPVEAMSLLGEVGDYVILGEVGRGGMGVVYHARHRGLGRFVALKMILAGGFASESQKVRFRREAELAARVQHPNIVQVYEIGLHEGRPFLAMEWVEGGTLADRIGTEPWAVADAARILMVLARAIDAAHRKGVIHRDLKPTNILIHTDAAGAPDDSMAMGVLKIADFGLARAIEVDNRVTSTGVAVGTPEYMAPEQASGKVSIGPAADIYALGAVFYHLLVGQPPFRGETPIEVLHALSVEEPVAPRRLRPRLPRDVETIALKALEKEPSRRYLTAGAMADDLARFLDGKPILARPPRVLDRVGKWAHREPVLAGLAATLAIVTMLGFAGITSQWLAAAAARDRAREATAEAVSQSKAERLTRYRAGISAAASAIELDQLDEARSILGEIPAEHRGWEWRHQAVQLDNSAFVFRPDDGPVGPFALAPDGDSFVYATVGDRKLRLRVPGENQDRVQFHGPATEIVSVAFRPDGNQIAAVSPEGVVHVWERTGGDAVARLEARNRAPGSGTIVFSPDGTRLLYLNGRDPASLWEPASGRQIAQAPGQIGQFSPDSRNVCLIDRWGMRLLDAVSGGLVASLDNRNQWVKAMAYSPDGSRIATGTAFPSCEILFREPHGDGRTLVMKGHQNEIRCLEYSPDGRILSSGSYDQTVRLWDIATLKPEAILRGHRAPIDGTEFTPDGRHLLTFSTDGAIRIWETAGGTPLGLLRGHASPRVCQMSRDGRIFAVADVRGCVRLWDIEDAIDRGVGRGHTSYVYDAAVDPEGRRIASASWDGTVRVWGEGTAARSATVLRLEGIGTAVAFSADGRRLGTFERDGVVRVWEAPFAKPLWSRVLGHAQGDPTDGRASFQPSGNLVAATGDRDGSVKLFDAGTGALRGALRGHSLPTTDGAFDASGIRLATGDKGGAIRIWDMASQASLIAIRAHDGPINRLAFHPDGQILASVSSGDRTARLWDISSGSLLATLNHGSKVYGVSFAPDGARLATACGDNTIRLWDTKRYEEVAALRGHQAYVHSVMFSVDGRFLVSSSGDYTVRIWHSQPSNRASRKPLVGGAN